MAKKNKKDKNNENEESLGGKIVSGIFVILIIAVWLVILAVLVRLDVGGFGSGVLRPVFKDVPVINKILPEPSEEELEAEIEENGTDQVATLSQAKELIAQLESENEELSKSNKSLKEQVDDLDKEVARLKVFEEDQANLKKEKEEFYNEIVYGENAPDADTYKEWYENIDAANAEAIYRQVISNEQSDSDLKNLAKTYENMKPAEAAAVLEKLANLDTVAEILSAMKAENRAKVMDEMDPAFAANVTKKLMP